MKRVLLTGMSGTGKSTLVAALAARGHAAVDADDEAWSEWIEAEGDPTGARPGRDWRWREDRIQELLATHRDGLLFVAGCAENTVRFHPRFDHIILLSAPVPVILERLASHSGNPYGKRTEERERVLAHVETAVGPDAGAPEHTHPGAPAGAAGVVAWQGGSEASAGHGLQPTGRSAGRVEDDGPLRAAGPDRRCVGL